MATFPARRSIPGQRDDIAHALDSLDIQRPSAPQPEDPESDEEELDFEAPQPSSSRPVWTAPTPSKKQLATSSKICAAENKAYGTDALGVRIESRAGRGRGLFASKSFKPGDTVYSVQTRPPAAVLSTSNLTSHCSACFLSARDAATLRQKEEEPLKRCSACRVIHYCSVACSRADWTLHKPECTTFQLLRKRHKERYPDTKVGSLEFLPHELSRALGRLLWAKKRAMDAGVACPAWDEYCLLQSQLESQNGLISKTQDESYRLAFYLGLAIPNVLEAGEGTALSLLMKHFGIDGNPDLELMKMWSRYQTNAFTLDSPDLTALGVVIAPALAMANHSCEPNAVVVFPRGQGMGQMVAIRPIQPNEEILVCYIDVASPFSQRQSELSSRYGFTCDCSLCQREQDASWVDPRWCLLHPGCKLSGKGRMIDSIKWDTVPSDLRPGMASGVSQSKSSASSAIRCSACGETYEVRERLLMTALSRAKSFLRSDEDGWLLIHNADTAPIIQSTTTVASQLLTLCPPSSYPLIPLHRLLTRLLTSDPPSSLPLLAVPLHHLTLAIEGARAIYASHHPTLAVLLAQRARLLGLQFPPTEEEMENGRKPEMVRQEMQRMAAAMAAYREAVTACTGCFGRDGGILGLGLRAEMDGLEREIGAMRLGMEDARTTKRVE